MQKKYCWALIQELLYRLESSYVVMTGFVMSRADSRFASSQWDAVLICNDVSHWLVASLESALISMYRYKRKNRDYDFIEAGWRICGSGNGDTIASDKGLFGALLLSESVGMCRPLDHPFSPQEHPLVGYSNVKNTPVGYHFFFVSSHPLWVIFVKFSYIVTLFGSFLWKFDTPVGVKIHPADTPVGVKIHPVDPSPLPVSVANNGNTIYGVKSIVACMVVLPGERYRHPDGCNVCDCMVQDDGSLAGVCTGVFCPGNECITSGRTYQAGEGWLHHVLSLSLLWRYNEPDGVSNN